MFEIFLFSMLIIAIGIVFISVRVFTKEKGEMHSFHIHDSIEMKERGIGCVMEQDREARKKAEETALRMKQYKNKNK